MLKPGKSLGQKIFTYLIEIIIIILGISISFGLNEWNKQRSDHTEYLKYLENLKEDIHVDSVQMVGDRRSYTRIKDGINSLMGFKAQYLQIPDSMGNLASAFVALDNFIEFLPNNNTFEQLSSTGDFNKFRNKELIKEVIQLYQYDYAYIRMMGDQAKDVSRNHLKPYFFNNIYLEDSRTFPKVKTNIPEVIEDRLFRNIILSYQGSADSAIRAYNRALKRLVKVDDMIDKELAKN